MRLFLAIMFTFTAFSAQAMITSRTFMYDADYVRLSCDYSYEVQFSDHRMSARFNMFARTTADGKMRFAYHKKDVTSYFFEIDSHGLPRGVWHNEGEMLFAAVLDNDKLSYTFALKNYYRDKSSLEIVRQEERELDVYSLFNYGFHNFKYNEGNRKSLSTKKGRWINRESVRIEGCTLEAFNTRHNPVIASSDRFQSELNI